MRIVTKYKPRIREELYDVFLDTDVSLLGQPFKSGRAKTSVAPRSLVDEAEGRSGE